MRLSVITDVHVLCIIYCSYLI